MTPTRTPTAAHQQAVPDRRRRLLILAICSMSLLIVGLDVTIVNVALPAIQRSFHAKLSGLQWTVDAYTLVLASLLMLAGSTADRLGRRRVFAAGLVLFPLGSLLCALAPSLSFSSPFAWCRRSAARCSARWRCRSCATCSRTRASGRGRSASSRRCSASRWRSGRCSAASSSPPSPGGRSSWSTCRSGWRRSC